MCRLPQAFCVVGPNTPAVGVWDEFAARRFYRCRGYDNGIGLLRGPEKFIGAPVFDVKWKVLVPARLAFWKISAGRALCVFGGVSYPVCEIFEILKRTGNF